MKLKPYTHVILMAILFIVALSLYGGWYATVGNESANAVSLESQIQAKNETAANAQEAKSQLAKALSDSAAITDYFVNTNDIVPFLETLQATGAKYGANVQVDSVTSQPAQPHTLLQLALRITGPFDSVERTLGAIEYEPYDTTVSNVTLDTPGAVGGGAPAWTAAVTMNVGTIDMVSTTTGATAPASVATTSASTAATATTTP